MSVPPSGGGVKNGRPRLQTSKVLFELDRSDAAGEKPSPPKPTPAPVAATNGHRLPRQPFTVNTLTADENPELPPDFVGSNYQKRHGVEQPGAFALDWVALVTGSNKAEYLVLAQIAYWFAESKKGELKVTVQRDGRWWLYKTYRQLAKDTRVLTAPAVRGAVRSLEEKRILITKHDPSRQYPKLYRIDPVVVAGLEEAAERRITKAMRKDRGNDYKDARRDRAKSH